MAWLTRTKAILLLAMGGVYALSQPSGYHPTAVEETVVRLRQAAQADASPPHTTPLRALTSKPTASDPHHNTRAVAPPLPTPSPATEALSAASRLARALQAELHRVGCYTGAIDGEWGPATRRAMADFNARVGAKLPVVLPDYILLTLLQGHAAQACGNACPLGQAGDSNGRCRPRAEIAASAGPATGATTSSAPWARAIADAVRSAQSRHDGQSGEADAPPLPTRRAAIARPAEPATASRSDLEARRHAETEAIAGRLRQQAQARQQERARAKAEIEMERRRIADAEARRRELAAQLQARAEAERLARQAEAATRRRAELAALAERRTAATAAESRRVTGSETISSASRPLPPAPQRIAAAIPLPQRPTPGRKPSAEIALRAPAVESWVAEPSPVASRSDLRSAPRFVGRFIPPPTYRVGRLPPRPTVRGAAPARQRAEVRPRVIQRPVRVRITPTRVRTRAVFHQLLRNAP